MSSTAMLQVKATLEGGFDLLHVLDYCVILLVGLLVLGKLLGSFLMQLLKQLFIFEDPAV